MGLEQYQLPKFFIYGMTDVSGIWQQLTAIKKIPVPQLYSYLWHFIRASILAFWFADDSHPLDGETGSCSPLPILVCQDLSAAVQWPLGGCHSTNHLKTSPEIWKFQKINNIKYGCFLSLFPLSVKNQSTMPLQQVLILLITFCNWLVITGTD